MKRLAAIGLLTLVITAPISAGVRQRLSMQVTPAIALAPAVLTVRAVVEPDDRNRGLQIAVSSSSYFTSSEIPLDGKSSQRVNVIALRDVPPGLYEVRVTLVSAEGRVASAMQLAKVQPSPGYSH